MKIVRDSSGTVTHEGKIVVTENFGRVEDIDGNSYLTIRIDNKCWTTENFKCTRYNDGTPIDYRVNVHDASGQHDYFDASSAAGYPLRTVDGDTEISYGWPNYVEDFGYLYNFNAAVDEKLPPTGWHLPTADEMDAMILFTTGHEWYNGTQADVEAFKSTDASLWIPTSYSWGIWDRGTNATGFNMHPGGRQPNSGMPVLSVGQAGAWWSSTLLEIPDPSKAWGYTLRAPANLSYTYISKYQDGVNQAFSVRFVKDC